MWRHYLKSAWRNAVKHKLFTVINVGGLAFGLLGVIIIFLYVQQELSYDRFHEKLDRTFVFREGADYDKSVYPALPQLLADYPNIESGTRLLTWNDTWATYQDKEVHLAITNVDTGFFDVFSFPLMVGDAQSALLHKNKVVLTKQKAEALFGKEDPLGKVLEFEEGGSMIVSGVLDQIPSNSSIKLEALVSLTMLEEEEWFGDIANWYNSFTKTYVLVAPDVDHDLLQTQFGSFNARYYLPDAQNRDLHLTPFSSFHAEVSDNRNIIFSLSLVALFLLIVISINFLNLTLGASLSRLQEVAVRKVMGSSRRQLTTAFLVETGLIAFGALLLAIVAVTFVLPQINMMWDLNLKLEGIKNKSLILSVAALVPILAILGGVYPAWYLTKRSDAQALKGKTTTLSGNPYLRNGLLVTQFAITTILVAASLVVSNQVHHMKTADLGFDQNNVLVVPLDLGYKNAELANERLPSIIGGLTAIPQVESFTTNEELPGKVYSNYNMFFAVGAEDQKKSCKHMQVSEGYFETLEIDFLEGRNFSDELKLEGTQNVIINRAAQVALGLDDPLETSLTSSGNGEKKFHIIGVVNDYHFRSLESVVEPAIHFFDEQAEELVNKHLCIRLNQADVLPVINYLESAMTAIPSRRPFEYSFLDEVYNEQYQAVERTLTLVRFFTLLTIIIACAGVFALTSIMVQKRAKEIGIRKVLGASVSSLVRLLSIKYMWLVVVAAIIAVPVIYLLMGQWLENFAYRIYIEWWLFLLAGFISLGIALLTVVFQSARAAVVNPVDSLRAD